MELVQIYLNKDYESLFHTIKSMWNKNRISATPEMAALIEQIGITRNSYKELRNSTLTIETRKGFYMAYLSLIIFAIDMQEFDEIDSILGEEYSIRDKIEQVF